MSLISSLEAQFEPEKYKDAYRENLLAMIDAKVQGKQIVETPTAQQLAPVVDIMEALRRSVEEIFWSLFGWDEGAYQLGPELPPPEDRVRPAAPTWALLLEGVRRKYSLERLIEQLGPPETVLLPTTALDRALAAFERAGRRLRVI